MSAVNRYYEALQRLVAGNPDIVPKPYKINNDTVAIEAGNNRGSIKKSRDGFTELVQAIQYAADNTKNVDLSSADKLQMKISTLSSKLSNTEDLYKEALGRELSLVKQVFELKKELKEASEKLKSNKKATLF